MRIAYIYDAVHPWETGGVQKRVWELARRLAGNHDVHWYGLHYWDGPRRIEQEGVILHGVAPAEPLYVSGRRSISEAITFATHLIHPLLREEFDVIDCQVFPYFPCFTSKLASIVNNESLLLTWHEVWGDYWYEYLGRKGVFGKTVEHLCSLVPGTHIAVSERTKRDIATLGATDIRLLPNGVSIREVEAIPTAEENIDVLFAGRLIAEKNVDLLIRAIDQLRMYDTDIQCWIIGEGPEHTTIEALIYERGLEENIRLLPFRDSYEEVLGLMKAADVFALLSQREGFGITALEALACGTPVVTIDHPQNAVQELVIKDETGTICKPTCEEVAKAIIRVQNTTSEATCKNYAASYRWDTIAEQAEKIYHEIT